MQIASDVAIADYTGSGNTRIGHSFDPRPFRGPLDNVRIYNRALSPDEIHRLYNMGR